MAHTAASMKMCPICHEQWCSECDAECTNERHAAAEKTRLTERVRVLTGALEEVRLSGVEYIGPKYILLQVDHATMDAVRAALAAAKEETK